MIDEKKLIEELEDEFAEKGDWQFTDEGVDYWNRAIKRAIRIANSQPQVGGWIPVSERLPEKSNRYEVTIEYDSKQLTGTAYYSTKEHRWSTYTNYVTAWRERLPEPYKAGEQE